MLAIQVDDWAAGPKATTVPAPPPPSPDEVQIRVTAVGLHQLVRSRAAGTHYTSGALPHRPGVDGVGLTADNTPVYFYSLAPGRGSFAETLNVRATDVFPLPPAVDPVQAAALVNPVMSSWMALTQRVDVRALAARAGPAGWAVLILGATTASGKLAAKVARQMGASRVVGAARRVEELQRLGLDDYVVLAADGYKTDYAAAAGVDVVLDYLYGNYAEEYLGQLKTAKEVTYVSIGSLAGRDANIPSAVLRSNNVTIRGAGPGSWSLEQLKQETAGMLQVLCGVQEDIKAVKLADVEEGWTAKGRVVFIV